MNGGAYNVLINTTSKPVASFAACLAVISYVATGVVSAATAVSYLQVFMSRTARQEVSAFVRFASCSFV